MAPDTAHTPVPLDGSTENSTGLPDPPPWPTTSLTGPPGPGRGGEPDRLRDAGHRDRLLGLGRGLVPRVAGLVRVDHAPAGWSKVTVAPEIEHTDALPGAMPRTTGLPELPPETVTV